MDASTPNKNVSCSGQRFWDVHRRSAMRRGCRWLEAFYFQSKICQLAFALLLNHLVFGWVAP